MVMKAQHLKSPGKRVPYDVVQFHGMSPVQVKHVLQRRPTVVFDSLTATHELARDTEVTPLKVIRDQRTGAFLRYEKVT